MADSDDFARATVASMLQPGEYIVAMGWMTTLDRNWRNQPGRYFGVGTNSRLIVIQSRAGLGTVPKCENHGVTWMDYAAMQTAGTRRFAELTDSLVVTGATGKLEYGVPSPAIIGAKGMDGHAQFDELYLHWLCRHVGTGSFRDPGAWQAALAEWQNPVALDAANVRFAPKSHAAARARLRERIKWPFVMALVAMAVALFVAIGGGKAHGRSAEEKMKRTLIVGMVGAGGFIVLGIVLNVRKRAAKVAEDKAREAGGPAA